MKSSILVFNPTESDTQSKVRGIGRYLQILKENFPDWNFINKLEIRNLKLEIFINPFFNFLQTPLVMRRIAKKQIAVIHDLIPLKYPDHFPIGIKGKLNVFLNKLSLKNYDRIITDSEASKKDIINMLGIENNKITVIYPCLPRIFIDQSQKSKETSSFPRRRESRLKLPYKDVIIDWIPSYEGMTTSSFCLYVGDATWNKNLVNLAKAIKILNVACIFVGKVFEQSQEKAQIPILRQSPWWNPKWFHHDEDFRVRRSKNTASSFFHPWQEELKMFFKEIKNDKRFILKGFVTDEELIQLYQHAKLNILPSRDEGFGFSYLEAASQTCPSVLADIPVLHEISNDQALFTNPNDPHDIANAIGELYWNSEKRSLIGGKAFERVKQFSSSVFKKQLLALL